MFKLEVNSDDTPAIVNAIKFMNWTILDVHKHRVCIEWKSIHSELLEIEYSVLDNLFIIRLNDKNGLGLQTNDYDTDTSVYQKRNPGLFQLLAVEIRNALALAI